MNDLEIVIIEDEHLIAQSLHKEIQSAGDKYSITEMLSSVKESIDYFNNNKHPNLIFSDIQLSDGLSFNIFEKVEIKSPVVFCTAFSQYTMDAFQNNGIDYILKPFTSEAVKSSLIKFDNLHQQMQPSKEVFSKMHQEFLANRLSSEKSSLLVFQKDNIIPVKVDDIYYINVENGNTYLYTKNQDRFLHSETMEKTYVTIGAQFFRINRQQIVNKSLIQSVSQYFGRKLFINPVFPTQHELIVSKSNATAFLNWLEA